MKWRGGRLEFRRIKFAPGLPWWDGWICGGWGDGYAWRRLSIGPIPLPVVIVWDGDEYDDDDRVSLALGMDE